MRKYKYDKLYNGGRNYIIVGMTIWWLGFVLLLHHSLSDTILYAKAIWCMGNIVTMLGASLLYEAKGRSEFWALYILAIGPIGFIPYYYMEKLIIDES